MSVAWFDIKAIWDAFYWTTSQASQLMSVCSRGNIPVVLTPCKDDAWSKSTYVLGSHKAFSWDLSWLP